MLLSLYQIGAEEVIKFLRKKLQICDNFQCLSKERSSEVTGTPIQSKRPIITGCDPRHAIELGSHNTPADVAV